MSMKHVVAAIVALMAVVCLLPVSDAAQIDNPSSTLSFNENDSGNIVFTVYSDSGFDMTVTVTDRSDRDRVVTTVEQSIGAGKTVEVSIPISGLSVGTHNLRVECEPSDEFVGSNGFNVTVEVTQSILSNWATYLVIVVVIIVVVVFAYLKMRDTPKSKPEMTFEELEAQRKAEMAAKAEKKQKKVRTSDKPTSERKKYVAEKKKDDKPKEEAPKMTFEELDAQKKAEKAAKAEKKSTGLTERERYLAEKRKKKEE